MVTFCLDNVSNIPPVPLMAGKSAGLGAAKVHDGTNSGALIQSEDRVVVGGLEACTSKVTDDSTL